MTRREKVLSMIVGGVFLLLLNLFLLKFFLANHRRLSGELAASKAQLEELALLQTDREVWEQRDAWITANQPQTKELARAGTELLNSVEQLAKKHSILLTRPTNAVERPINKPEYSAVSVNFEAVSDWGNLVDFMRELQAPANFQVFESIKMEKDPKEPTKMQVKPMRIAKWYAPITAPAQ